MTSLFATCNPGLEEVLLEEVQALPGVTAAAAQAGGVEFAGSGELIMRANLLLRSANRVLLRVGRVHATRMEQLRDGAAALPWEEHLRSADAEVRATCRKSRIYHSGAAAERVLLGIRARLRGDGRGPSSRRPLVVVRGMKDLFEISLDTSGELLHLRGYRKQGGEAPLRESLAAGLLLLAGYAGGPLLDLCTGSGTFAIEGELIRRRIAPGLLRGFAFEESPSHDQEAWRRIREEALARRLPPGAPATLALDIDERACALARGGATIAGVAEGLRVRTADLFRPDSFEGWPGLLDRPHALVVINPPYGRRIDGGQHPQVFYRRLGRTLCARLAGARALILAAEERTLGALSLRLDTTRVKHGGLWIIAARGRIEEQGEERRQDQARRQQAEQHRQRPG